MIKILPLVLPFLFHPSSAFSECRGSDCSILIAPERNVEIPDVDRKVTKYCAPDNNGMVGVKSGRGYILPYAFGIEKMPNSPIEDILNSVRSSVQFFLIEFYFPEKCVNIPIRRKLERSDVQGLNFDYQIESISSK
jgi:hypothetical protein